MPQLIRDLSLDGRLHGGKSTSQQQVCVNDTALLGNDELK